MKHLLWHYVVGILVSEVNNLMWLAVGVVITLVGVVIVISLGREAFYLLALGLPLILIGVSVVLFKIHELILTLADKQRLKALCKFCFSGDEE